MKNRIWVFVVAFVAIALFSIEKIAAQKIQSWGSYIHVRNYSGDVEKKAFTLQLEPKGNEYLNSELSISVEVNSPIANSQGVFNAEKLKISLNSITGGLILSGASTRVEHQLNDGAIPVEIIKSNADLRRDQTYQFSFDIIIEGGAYLDDMVRDNAYNVGLKFYVTIRTKEGSVFKEVYSNNTYNSIGMQIHNPLGGTPPKPTFGFVVNADASLKFATPEDYTKQVESTENSWLKVTSKDKGYQIWVNSGDANFNGDSSAPPVNVVSMKVGDGTPITLSKTNAPGQVVYTGNATNQTAKELNVRYYITSEKSKELVKYGGNDYTTQLTYTLIPN